MAYGDDFVNLKDPKARAAALRDKARQSQPTAPAKEPAAAPAARQPAQGGGMFDQLVGQLDNIQDPFTRSLVQGALEARISDRIGQQFHFPDPEEEELQKVKTQRELMKERVEVDKLAVQIAQSQMLDLDDKQRAALGIEPGEDIFSTRPEMVPEVTGLLHEAGRLDHPISLGMLKNAGLPTNATEAVTMEEQRTAKTSEKLGQAAGAIGHAEKLAKTFAEAQEGEGLIGESFKAGVEATESQTGVDAIAESDEDKGSSIFYSMTNNLVQDVAAKTGQDPQFVASAALSGAFGENLRDELEGLDTNDADELSIDTEDDMGITGVAKFYLTASALNLGASAGLTDSETMKALKLPYSGVDFDAFYKAGQAVAKKRGIKEEVLWQSLGPGVDAAMSRMQAKGEAVKKALKAP